ncbi:NUDIX hydrolase [Lihuaxuella thermophila]|uniref:8-oxo-dGTP diphosphatase n=1 Tax=Lihuaxuella thermophila TaxID=1173111 RepID=A0A1H8CXE7_9BACL|nr:NUDIX hydrolase [Lihuaxuella thermophila]SEM99670.1 8-oxo-dGTP diphosphatase [Lihuaxuella thermophila]
MYQKIVCTGFIYHQGKTLIVERSLQEAFLPGYYELPGGKVDFGEDPADALKREFREEVNLNVEVIKPYKIFSYLSENGTRHTVEIVYLVHLTDDPANIQLSEDHSAYQWISENEVLNYLISDETKDSIFRGFKAAPPEMVNRYPLE